MAVVISQVTIAVVIKSAIKRMYQLFFCLQMVCALPIIQISFPVLVEIILRNIKLVIFFEILKPNILLPYLGVKMTLEEVLGINKTELILTDPSLLANDVESINSLKNLKIYLMIILIVSALMIIALFLAVVIRPMREKILDMIKDSIREFMWNGAIKSVYLSYLPQLI